MFDWIVRLFTEKRELREELERKDRKIKSLEDEKAGLLTKLEAFAELSDGTPSDCVRGEWCKHCEFVKVYHYYEPGGIFNTPKSVYFCGKGQSCENFLLKEKSGLVDITNSGISTISNIQGDTNG